MAKVEFSAFINPARRSVTIQIGQRRFHLEPPRMGVSLEAYREIVARALDEIAATGAEWAKDRIKKENRKAAKTRRRGSQFTGRRPYIAPHKMGV